MRAPLSPWYQNQAKISHIQKRKLQANITDEHRSKNPQQNTSKPIPTTLERIVYHNRVGFIPAMHVFFNICKSINVIYHINKLNNETIWSSLQMQKELLTFMIKALLKVGTEGTYLNIKRPYITNPQLTKCWKTESIPSMIKNKDAHCQHFYSTEF